MAKKYEENIFELPEEEMQAIIAKAQNNSPAAQSQMLHMFDNFLSRYVTLLYYGKWSMADYDLRKFIWLFVTDPGVRYHLLRGKLNQQGYQSVNEVMRRITGMAQRYGDEEDVRQTVEVTFLECLMRYKPTPSKQGGIVPFKSFLYSYYLYMLKKNVEFFLIDQLGRKTFPLITDEESFGDDGSDFDGQTPGYTAPSEPSAEELLGTEEIDEYWVIGDSAMAPFDQLTIQERQLLKWRFVDGLPSSEIAAKITEHPNTCREHFNRIRHKLREIIASETY